MRLITAVGHLCDAAMLLLAEGALGSRDARRAEAHLRACAACRARSASLLQADADLRLRGDAKPAEQAPQREILASRLREEAGKARKPMNRRFLRLLTPRLLRQAGVAIVLAATLVALRHVRVLAANPVRPYEDAGPRPNPKLTPGSVSPIGLADLCRQGDRDLDPKLAPERVRAVYRAYGINVHAAASYQVDYLINPQLGGNDQMANLWPEPYDATLWNATAKDELERKLHGMVCSGDVELREAQHDLASDWIAAYKKYLHASPPLTTVALDQTVDAPGY